MLFEMYFFLEQVKQSALLKHSLAELRARDFSTKQITQSDFFD